MPFVSTTPPVKMEYRSVRRRSGIPKLKIIFPLKMAKAHAAAIPIVMRRSGDRVHVPLHADGVGAVQLDVHGTGVV